MEYEYRCKECKKEITKFFKTIQKDTSPIDCEVTKGCKGEMTRIISKPHVLFNCPGFYSTDVLGKGSTRMQERKAVKEGHDKMKDGGTY